MISLHVDGEKQSHDLENLSGCKRWQYCPIQQLCPVLQPVLSSGVPQAEADLWNADPFDPAAQARIAERIQQEHIAHNYEQAYENNPEVTMQTVSF